MSREWRRLGLFYGAVVAAIITLGILGAVFLSPPADAGGNPGDVCGTSQGGDGNVYVDRYGTDGVCRSEPEYRVGHGDDLYATTTAQLFPPPRPANTPCSPGNCPAIIQPAVDPCDGQDTTVIKFHHTHHGNSFSSGEATDYDICRYELTGVTEDRLPGQHNHFWGENGGQPHEH